MSTLFQSVSNFNLHKLWSNCNSFLFDNINKTVDKIQKTIVFSLLAIPPILSYAGVLSPKILTVMKNCSIYQSLFLGSVFLYNIMHYLIDKKSYLTFSKQGYDDSTYKDLLNSESFFGNTVFSPISEESVFRLGLQGSLQAFLGKILPSTALSILGSAIPLSHIASIALSSTAFGAIHSSNDHKLSIFQSIYAGITGVFLGYLYSSYGFWASCFAHILNNTLSCSVLSLLNRPEAIWNNSDLENKAIMDLGPLHQKKYIFFKEPYSSFLQKMNDFQRISKKLSLSMVVNLKSDNLVTIKNQKDWDTAESFATKDNEPHVFIIDKKKFIIGIKNRKGIFQSIFNKIKDVFIKKVYRK